MLGSCVTVGIRAAIRIEVQFRTEHDAVVLAEYLDNNGNFLVNVSGISVDEV